MGECRENLSLWLTISHAFKFNSGFSEKFKYIKRRIKLKDYHFWHDSFGKFISRYITCPLFGHGDVKYLPHGGCVEDKPIYHCFKCERQVDPNYEKVRHDNFV